MRLAWLTASSYTSDFLFLISQHPFSSILWHSNPVTRLVVLLGLLQLVVQLEDGLSVLFDGVMKVCTTWTLQM